MFRAISAPFYQNILMRIKLKLCISKFFKLKLIRSVTNVSLSQTEKFSVRTFYFGYPKLDCRDFRAKMVEKRLRLHPNFLKLSIWKSSGCTPFDFVVREISRIFGLKFWTKIELLSAKSLTSEIRFLKWFTLSEILANHKHSGEATGLLNQIVNILIWIKRIPS